MQAKSNNSSEQKGSSSDVEATATDYWAAIDLGSNSFHLLLVRPYGASFEVVERLKEKVQLFAGFADGRLTDAAQARGLACIARFAQRLRSVPRRNILIMGTFALRRAENSNTFCAAANKILGTRVEVISGEEEARLIYLAVAHHLPTSDTPRLVIDVGGGSTELALGQRAHTHDQNSVDIGVVALRDRFFGDLGMRIEGYAAAKQYAVEALQEGVMTTPIAHMTEAARELRVYGTSGTMESMQTVLAANGWITDTITRGALLRLEAALLAGRWVIEAGVPGLAPDRTDIFPAGVAIVSALFAVLKLESLDYVDVSLLQGMICDAVVVDVEQDLRDGSVARLADLYGVDEQQARRVERRAMDLYAQSNTWWEGDEECARLLRWAAQLHEIGAHINPKNYHRHGGYVVTHTELPGFGPTQKRMLALLIRGHRRSIPWLAFQSFTDDLADLLIRLVTLLRIAVVLERGHAEENHDVVLTIDGDTMTLRLTADWWETHPLSARELAVEVGQLSNVGLTLRLEGMDARE